MPDFDSTRHILDIVEKATQKLSKIEITPKIQPVLGLLSSIVRLIKQFDQLVPSEREDGEYLCLKVNAHLNLRNLQSFTFDLRSGDGESARRRLKEMSEIFGISVGWLMAEGVVFELPDRIDPDLAEGIGKILWLCKSKKITVNTLPLELAPFIQQLNDLCIRADSVLSFERSLVVLQRCGIRPDQSITFSNIDLRNPPSYLALICASSLYETKHVTVF